MDSDEQQEVMAVAREIEHYLAAHPRAADSLEGITRWWLMRQRIHYELSLVEAALRHLCRKGVVASSPLGDDALYRLKRQD